ncbi:sulfite exporter TauE/SafE family protein [Roseovarius spongiae]|nr:sulfite exporter TauE/SafE family protein [Roseovarius spongiae]
MTAPDSALLWGFAVCVTLLAGVIKGVVGFALPMVMISGLSSVMPPELALAAMMIPTVLANLMQALRQGPRAAWETIRRFWIFLVSGGVALVATAQLVPMLPSDVLYLLIGLPVTLYAGATLAGRALRLPPDPGARTMTAIGALTGAMGGVTGVLGPPTVAMLTAQGTEKRDQVRIQGVIYGLGALTFLFAHVGSGVLRVETLPLSLALVPPALIGIWLGFRIQDRIDQAVFRRATLLVLLVAGVNLLRRALVVMQP